MENKVTQKQLDVFGSKAGLTADMSQAEAKQRIDDFMQSKSAGQKPSSPQLSSSSSAGSIMAQCSYKIAGRIVEKEIGNSKFSKEEVEQRMKWYAENFYHSIKRLSNG